jgi:hypothetical protein
MVDGLGADDRHTNRVRADHRRLEYAPAWELLQFGLGRRSGPAALLRNCVVRHKASEPLSHATDTCPARQGVTRMGRDQHMTMAPRVESEPRETCVPDLTASVLFGATFETQRNSWAGRFILAAGGTRTVTWHEHAYSERKTLLARRSHPIKSSR